MRFSITTALLLGLCGCIAPSAPPITNERVAPAPLLGRADGTDTADRECKVILRAFTRELDESGEAVVRDGWFVWTATVDVAQSLASEGAVAELLYRPATAGDWFAYEGRAVEGGGDGFQRFAIEVVANTTPTPIMELRSWEYQRGELAVYAARTNGARIFAHNRVSPDFVNYELTPTNDFEIETAPGICPAESPRVELDFLGAGQEEQHGSIVAGGKLTVNYELARLTQCRYSRAGAQLWDIEANIKFQPQGILVTRSVTQVVTPGGMGPTRVAVPLEVDIPLGTQYVDVWFRNFSAADRCEAYDSNNSQNYRFGGNPLPSPVVWAGDWGNGFSRSCEHRDGIEEPVRIDSYIRERACKFIDADVYVPGLTDAEEQHPERIWAEAEIAWDGGEPSHVWLVSQGRVGNNYRYRFTLPYEATGFSNWDVLAYTFRFSTDGVNYYRIGQADGSPRTIVRAF